jgi:ATP adenylyltransferase
MTLDELLQFLRRDIRMSHIYQPVLIKTLLDNAGFCTRRQLALALLMQDESQIEYYEKRLRDMPLPVLKKRGVISESDGIVRLEADKLSLQDRASIRLECDSLIQKFIVQRGIRIWDHRMIDDEPVPDSVRYQVLKRDRRCLLCGATAKDKPLHVDHIVPRSKGGATSLDNLQTLCFECNGGKNNKDDTDFREV